MIETSPSTASEQLGQASDKYAVQHEGQDFLPNTTPKSPLTFGSCPILLLPYIYLADRTSDQAASPLAYEPEVFEGDPWVLLTNGTMRRIPPTDPDGPFTR